MISLWRADSDMTILPEAARDVILGEALAGPGEEGLGGPLRDEGSLKQERRAVRDSRRLLHVVGHDRDRHGGLDLDDELLDLGGRRRIQRGCRLVQEKD